ncbi:universal stress protein [Alcanivorax quisquiliarum]|uniref:Universal stress protein n=1 Tax=Alcanivorax quisquiliarum TaxID=2933565 RepID=A0ABT0E7J1_9GAMM|nr:universal stress protein [Alcanivorax quisquiliarum]MCK0537735.1 universal stress protein [Alcanivorax quisquiliarum]
MTAVTDIRIATDFSPHAERAALRGARLAQALNAPATLIHVPERPRVLAVQSLLDEQHGAAIEQAMASAVAAVDDSVGVRLQGEVREGSKVGTTLLDGANSGTLVVVGGQGEHAWRDRMLGSTASGIVRRSTGPVLAVRGAVDGPYRKVLVPVDLSAASRPALELALTVAPDAEIEVLHTWAPLALPYGSFAVGAKDLLEAHAREQEETGRKGLEELVASAGLEPGRVTLTLRKDFPTRGILSQAEESGADLLVLGRQSGNPVEKWFVGSVTLQVLTHSDSDVLIVPLPG